METVSLTATHPDALYIRALKEGDGTVIRRFFYGEIAPLIHHLNYKLFDGRADFDELVSELYLFLREDSWRRLDTFVSRNSCRLKSWIVVVAWRHFMAVRDRFVTGVTSALPVEAGDVAEDFDAALRIEISLDIRSVLDRMPCRRYAEVIDMLVVRQLPVDEAAAALGVRPATLYTLKHRAIEQFLDIYRR